MELKVLKISSFVKKSLTVLLFSCSVCFYSAASESAATAFVEACRFYSRGEWSDAKIMFRKAVSYSENMTPEAYYMLISSEIYDGDNKKALDDCNFFVENFPDSLYFPRVSYQKGKLLYSLGEYEKAIVVLSDFCHGYSSDDLYSYALFYIGESLFAGYKYDEAEAIYERIVNEFPDAEKTPAAQYRLETILQRGREEKLLYLLKQTGEEYLAAKEEYEKQLRLYNSEAVDSARQKLAAAQNRNDALEKKVADLELQINILKTNQTESNRMIQELKENEKDVPAPQPYDETKLQLKILKNKALEAQKMLDERNTETGGE